MAMRNEAQNRCVAVISSLEPAVVRSQYDSVLAALSYDWSVHVVFFPAAACRHLDVRNPASKAWKGLPLYGVQGLWVLSDRSPAPNRLAVSLGHVAPGRVQQWLRQARWII